MLLTPSQKIPPLSSNSSHKRLQSAKLNQKPKRFLIISIDKQKSQLLNKSKIKIKVKPTQDHSLGECCGSPVSWLKKSKKVKKYSSSRKFFFQKEENAKFTNLCFEHSPDRLQGIDEVDEVIITSTSNERIKGSHSQSYGNATSKSCEKSKNKSSLLLFKTMSKRIELDKFLNKTITCKNGLIFKPGEIINESPQNIIYKCLNIKTGSIFIAKSYTDPEQIDKYKNEISIMSKLNSNDNIIKYIGNELIQMNTPFIFMEFASGGSIKSLIETYGNLHENIIKEYLIQILIALDFMHSNNIIHCDLKCSNILLDGNTGKIKLSDFGSAKEINNNKAKGLIGTLPWCAPEIICNKTYGTKVDIWSLGCCLIEMLSGRAPWSEKKIDNYYQCVIVIGKGNEIPEIPGNCSEECRSFILKCLNRNEDERWSANELMKHSFVLKNE